MSDDSKRLECFNLLMSSSSLDDQVSALQVVY